MGALDACNASFNRGSVVPTLGEIQRQRRICTTKVRIRTSCDMMHGNQLPIVHAGKIIYQRAAENKPR